MNLYQLSKMFPIGSTVRIKNINENILAKVVGYNTNGIVEIQVHNQVDGFMTTGVFYTGLTLLRSEHE